MGMPSPKKPPAPPTEAIRAYLESSLAEKQMVAGDFDSLLATAVAIWEDLDAQPDPPGRVISAETLLWQSTWAALKRASFAGELEQTPEAKGKRAPWDARRWTVGQ